MCVQCRWCNACRTLVHTFAARPSMPSVCCCACTAAPKRVIRYNGRAGGDACRTVPPNGAVSPHMCTSTRLRREHGRPPPRAQPHVRIVFSFGNTTWNMKQSAQCSPAGHQVRVRLQHLGHHNGRVPHRGRKALGALEPRLLDGQLGGGRGWFWARRLRGGVAGSGAVCR